MLHFHIPWKRQKTSDYVMVLGGGEMEHSLHKKWSFPLKISSVNFTNSAGNRRFGHIY